MIRCGFKLCLKGLYKDTLIIKNKKNKKMHHWGFLVPSSSEVIRCPEIFSDLL